MRECKLTFEPLLGCAGLLRPTDEGCRWELGLDEVGNGNSREGRGEYMRSWLSTACDRPARWMEGLGNVDRTAGGREEGRRRGG